MLKLKSILYKKIFDNKLGVFILNLNFKKRFKTSSDYWETRYSEEGNSGMGSYGALATYKANVLNKFVNENSVLKVTDFGCGDSNQVKEFDFPLYFGLDVSITALEKCIHNFKNDHTKKFFIYEPKTFVDNLEIFKADLTLSLDVIYHLIEEETFESYMHHLFSSSSRFVIIYAWDVEGRKKMHVRHRKFTLWVEEKLKGWHLIQIIENKDLNRACDFFIYEKTNSSV